MDKKTEMADRLPDTSVNNQRLASDMETMRALKYGYEVPEHILGEHDLNVLRARQIYRSDAALGSVALIWAAAAFIGIPFIIVIAIMFGR